MSEAHEAIENLSAERRVLLKKLLGEKLGSAERRQAIPRRVQHSPCPLSYSQQLMWLADQLIPQGSTYNVPIPLCLEGTLNVDALQRTIQAIQERHEIFRTTIQTVDGEPMQFIGEPQAVEMPVLEVAGGNEEERQQEMRRLCFGFACEPFELAKDRPLRVKLYRLGPHNHVLMMMTHHVAFDGASRRQLYREIEALYEAFCEDRPSPLPEMAIQYADYAVWQREAMKGEVMEKHLRYWKQRLADAPQVLELPTDRPRPAAQSFRGARQFSTVPQALQAGLRDLRLGEGTTLFMITLAAFSILLHRYTGEESILIGTPVLGRDREDVSKLIGYLSNTLVLRIDFKGDASFRDFLGQVREVVLNAFDHQEMPLERLVSELQPVRDNSRSPLFQVMFSAGNLRADTPKLPGLKVSTFKIDRGITKVDLTMALTESSTELLDACEYSTDLFDAETAARTLGHYHMLLSSIVQNPDQRISELRMLTEEEERQIFFEWNHTQQPFPSNSCIHHLFEEQARQTPEATAAEYAGQRLTYGELNRRAEQLAGMIRRMGCRRGAVVGLCVERSLEVAVGILGTLKAGAACLPLDPEYPTERLEFMVRDSGCSLLLTQRRLAERLTSSAAKVAALDGEMPETNATGSGQGFDPVRAEDAAFVLYTSGSTGEPKGVVLSHRGLVNHNVATAALFELAPGDRVLQFASLSFDLALEEMFPAWSRGATVVYRPDGLLITGTVFLDWLAAERISVIDLPTAFWQQWVRELANANASLPQHLRLLILGGDRALASGLAAWREIGGDRVRWINTYGPTEASIIAAAYEPGRHGYDETRDPPIGRPIANTQLYVLDRQQRPVPTGVPGELCIGGEGVAYGYLNRPELTAERFVADPFRAGKVMYRTGDRVRWLADGNLEFLGRSDNQVKIRGFRVELEEIESALNKHEGVRECVVVVREEVPGEKRLAAYVVGSPGRRVDPASLRTWCAERLPEYMVPSGWKEMESLPRLPNGKVDRRSLPAPDALRAEGGSDEDLQWSPTEEVMAAIWADVLKLGQVGRNDSFFDLGGHSLLATQVVSRVRRAFQVELPLRALFEAPTVAGLAERVEQLRREEQGLVLPSIQPVQRGGALPLSFAQQRLWILEQLDPGSAAYNMPSIVRLRGRLDADTMGAALQEIVRRHESLRTSFHVVDGEPRQLISASLRVPLTVVDLRHLPAAGREAEANRIVSEEVARPFELAAAPLLRAGLLRLSDDEQVVVLNLHHILSDGWSAGILWQELSVLYAAFLEKKPSPLAELPIQYADYAAWQREYLTGATVDTQLAYWKEKLAGAPPILELPTDHARPQVQTSRGSREVVLLPQALLESLKELSRHEGATLFMTLMTAFSVLLARYSGQDDIVLGTPVAGRSHAEVERLIGLFVNTLVMRADLSGEPSFRELLVRVRETAMGAYANQELPFEKLVEELRPERDLSRNAIFQVMFILQNVPSSGRRLGECEASGFGEREFSAKFDQSWVVSEAAGGLRVAVVYNADLFEANTIRQMLTHFQNLLEGAAASPDTCVFRLPMLGHEERNQLLVEWNETKLEYPQNVCVHELVEQQAEKTPDRVAVVGCARQLTYRELQRRSNQLARHLQKLGVQRGDLVGLMVDRTPELLVVLLAVWKAGAAYVPLDPAHPKERLELILQDTALRLILSDRNLVHALPDTRPTTLRMDGEWGSVAAEPADDLPRTAMPNDLAYVIYTSGSTGKPKGVQIEHRSLVNFLFGMMQSPGFSSNDTWMATTTLSFDISTLELLLPLIMGARTVVASRHHVTEPAEMMRLLEECNATVMQATPATWTMLLDAGWDGISGLKILCGGEALQPELANPLLKKCRELWNVYGPTETTVWCTTGRIEIRLRDTAPLGRPIANTRIYIVDSHGEPVPVGVRGELLIGGDGVARGYLNRPELTSERFIASRFVAGDRLYRTGDLASYQRDGSLRFHGRLDFQVKIRGHRIELGEIESILGDHADVERAVAIVREDHPGAKMIVAYVVVKRPSNPLPAELLGWLEKRLPSYMVPSAIVRMAGFPLTGSGKINRQALPRPEWTTSAASAHPRDEMEQILIRIWQRVLGLDAIGIYDNFFDLGGHSLLAVKLLSEVEKVVGRKIPLATLFRGSTVALLAELLRDGGEADTEPLVVELQAGAQDQPRIFAIAEPGAPTLGYAQLSRQMGMDQAFYKVQAPGQRILDRELTPAELQKFASQYLEGMRAIQSQGPYFIVAMCGGCQIAAGMIQQLEAEGQEVGLYAVFDTWALGNVHRWLPWRIYVTRERLQKFWQAGAREKIDWVKRAVRNRILSLSGKVVLSKDTFKAVYFPKDGQAARFHAPVIVFKRPKQLALYVKDPTLGWGSRTSSTVEIHTLDIQHNEFLREPYLRDISEILLSRISAVTNSKTGDGVGGAVEPAETLVLAVPNAGGER